MRVIAHIVDFGLGMIERRAGLFRIAGKVMESGFLDQGITEIESHAGGLGDVADLSQTFPRPT